MEANQLERRVGRGIVGIRLVRWGEAIAGSRSSRNCAESYPHFRRGY